MTFLLLGAIGDVLTKHLAVLTNQLARTRPGNYDNPNRQTEPGPLLAPWGATAGDYGAPGDPSGATRATHDHEESIRRLPSVRILEFFDGWPQRVPKEPSVKKFPESDRREPPTSFPMDGQLPGGPLSSEPLRILTENVCFVMGSEPVRAILTTFPRPRGGDPRGLLLIAYACLQGAEFPPL